MIDFLILYEVKPREIESIVMLGNELKIRGYQVEYVSFVELGRANYFLYRKSLKKYRDNVKVLLVPSFYHDNELMDLFYCQLGKAEKIVNLRWEQYFMNRIMDNPTDNMYLYPNESAVNAYHLCWGTVSYENMLEVGIKREKLLQTGPLHMDILRKEFISYYKNKEDLLQKYAIDSKRKTFLFISSFSNATDRTDYFEYLDEFFSGKYVIDKERIKLELQSYRMTINWIDELLNKYPDINFVYRPHPSEKKTDLLNSLERKHKQFRVISDYSVKQWIITCDTIITWMSTSVIEAYFAGKECFVIRPVSFPYESDMSIYRNATFITTLEEFLTIPDVECINSLDIDYISKCYDVGEIPSYIRLSDELERIYNSQDYFPWNDGVIKQFNRSGRKQIIKKSIRKGLSTLRSYSLLYLQKKLGISYGERTDNKLKNFLISRESSRHFGDELMAIDQVLGPMIQEKHKMWK